MKKIIKNRILQLCCILIALLSVACESNERGAPVLTGVRNYAPSPDDTVLQSLQPGQWITLTGHNLGGAKQIVINGVVTQFNASLFSDTYAVVQVPAVIPFPIIPAEMQNKIMYFTDAGSTTFSFDVVAPAPTVTDISNEMANPGDSVTIYGTNLFLLSKLTFAGTEITKYSSSSDGTYVGFVLPSLSGTGPVVVENASGSFSTFFNVNDTSVLCNFDDKNTLSWGPSVDNSTTTFRSDRGYYAILRNNGLSAKNYSWWEGDRGINTNPVQWVPQAAIDDPQASINDYAVKFEINVPQKWEGTSVYLLKDYDWTYVARFEPWNLGNNKTAPYTTYGWRTITVPLSQFLKKANSNDLDGTGNPAPNLKTLLGSTGSGSFHMYTINDAATASATSLNMAVDNIRVVKIK